MTWLPEVAAPAAGQAPPPGNPDQIRSSGHAFGAAAAALASQAPWVRQCATVDGWLGASADAYRDRMAAIARRIDRAGRAMQHGSAALLELAARLEDAQLRWAQASAIAHSTPLQVLHGTYDDPRQARRLLDMAHQEAEEATRIARERLAGVTSELHALGRQAKGRLPQPPSNGVLINPCGAFPQEASSMAWSNGIIPLDTVCLVYAETIIEVDGEPVSVTEPIPIYGPGSTTDTRGKGRRANKVDPNNADAIPINVKIRVQDRIRRALAVGDEGLVLQAGTAQNLRVRGVRVIGFGEDVLDKWGKPITDIDIETEHALIEVSVRHVASLTRPYKC